MFRFKEQSENDLLGLSTAAHQLLLSNIRLCNASRFWVFFRSFEVDDQSDQLNALRIQTEFVWITLMRIVFKCYARLAPWKSEHDFRRAKKAPADPS